MKEKEIDYNLKILNFLSMTNTDNQDFAIKYLEENSWDEIKACNKFLNQIYENEFKIYLINDNIFQNNTFNLSNNSSDKLFNINNFGYKIGIKNENKNKKENILHKIGGEFYRFLFKCCSNKRKISKSKERKIFQLLPNLVNDLVEFCNIIGRKIGIIIFYDVNSINFLINYIEQITRSKNIMNLIRENFVFYPILDDTKEGKKIQELILDDNNNNELILATFIFYFNQHNNENPDLNTILNKNNIINISKVISTDINTFY